MLAEGYTQPKTGQPDARRLALQIATTTATVHRWLAGSMIPGERYTRALANALHTIPEALLYGTDYVPVTTPVPAVDPPVVPPQPEGSFTVPDPLVMDRRTLDADMETLGWRIARELTDEVRAYPQRRASLIAYFYNQLDMAIWGRRNPWPAAKDAKNGRRERVSEQGPGGMFPFSPPSREHG